MRGSNKIVNCNFQGNELSLCSVGCQRRGVRGRGLSGGAQRRLGVLDSQSEAVGRGRGQYEGRVAICRAAVTVSLYRVTHMIMEKLFLKLSVMFSQLVGCCCSCPAAQTIGRTLQFCVNKSSSMSIQVTL